MREVENAMVLGEYYANWVDATDEDREEAAADVESRIRSGEMREELVEYLICTEFVGEVVDLLLADKDRQEAYLELRELLGKYITDLADEQAD